MDTYKHYPKIMRHPGAAEARVVHDSPVNTNVGQIPGGTVAFAGTPDRFPPVTVKNADEEEYYKAQGYIDTSNPQAFAASKAGIASSGSVQEFPRMMYHDTDEAITVDDERERDSAILMGYRLTIHKPEIEQSSPPSQKEKVMSAAGLATHTLHHEVERAEDKAPHLLAGADSGAGPMSEVQKMIAEAVASALAANKAPKPKSRAKARPKCRPPRARKFRMA